MGQHDPPFLVEHEVVRRRQRRVGLVHLAHRQGELCGERLALGRASGLGQVAVDGAPHAFLRARHLAGGRCVHDAAPFLARPG
jgi:hypothetical protein